MSKLFSGIPLDGLRLDNRIAVLPMCQYSAVNGVAQDWHLIHLGSLALDLLRLSGERFCSYPASLSN